GICDSVPNFMALEVAFILKRLSGFSSEFARFGSMTRLQKPCEHHSRFVLSWNPHRTLRGQSKPNIAIAHAFLKTLWKTTGQRKECSRFLEILDMRRAVER